MNTRIRILPILLVVAVMLTVTSASALTSGYTDIAGNWAEDVIDRWVDYGVLTIGSPGASSKPGSNTGGRRGSSPSPAPGSTQTADTKFRPNDHITRGELALIISNMMRYQTVGTAVYNDVDADNVPEAQRDAIRKCAAAGVMQGSAGFMSPLGLITREQAVVMIGRAMEITPSDVPSASFRDIAEISPYAKNMVLTFKERGYVIGGGDGYFNPKSNMTRAEAVKLLDNIVVNGLYSKPGVFTVSSMGNVVINVDKVELKGATITGDLIISEGVGDKGSVTLTDVTVNGTVFIRGGSDLILNGQCKLGDVRQLKTKSSVKIRGGVSGIIEKLTVAPGSGAMTLSALPGGSR
ncbi:MAG: S-layer homology domain-containing protein, partial [Oscillospiraceae bacterium]|nr:S-layer homology domain-containing protein [Oscillospiraceae bacterium]